MNQLQSLNERDLARLAVRRLTRFVTVVELIYIVLYSLVLNPIYTHFVSDVLYQDAWWLSLIGLACDLLDPILFIIVYPTTIHPVARRQLRLQTAGRLFCAHAVQIRLQLLHRLGLPRQRAA